MFPNDNLLHNANLDESSMLAASYNELPHIDDMRHAAATHVNAHAQLLGLIATSGLTKQFSIHLVHKHFNIPDNRVMVYEKVCGLNHPDFVLCSPRDPAKVEKLRGLYFRALPGGKMAAYEYTTEPGEDMSKHGDFIAKFAQTVMALGVQNVFALTAKGFQGSVLTEFEMSDVISTVLVDSPTWLPSGSARQSTSTDWMATSDYAPFAVPEDGSVPGIITLKCLETKSAAHYNVTCSATRSGSHYQSKPAFAGDELLLDGEPLPKDSEPYALISHARALVEVF